MSGRVACPFAGCGTTKPDDYALRDHVLNVHPERFAYWRDDIPYEALRGLSERTGDTPGHRVPAAAHEAAEDPTGARGGAPGMHRVERYAATMYRAATGRDWDVLPVGDPARTWWIRTARVAVRLADDDLLQCVQDKNKITDLYKRQLSEAYVELEQLRLMMNRGGQDG